MASTKSALPKRKIKDTDFKNLFHDKNNLLKLYQTLHPDDTTATVDDLTDITHESVLTDGIYNTQEAIDEAIRMCQDRNILLEYLKSREQEVKTIMGELFNQERATELYFKDLAKDIAREAAREANERADKADARANQEATRADKAEAEVKRLKALLAKVAGNVAVL